MCCSAFVCALWKESECPFRVMDEFDVYMVSYPNPPPPPHPPPTHTHPHPSGSQGGPIVADGGPICFALGIAR